MSEKMENGLTLADKANESAEQLEQEKETWKTIPLNEILWAIESASDEYGQCYDFRTKQTLWVGGYSDSFREGFLDDLAQERPELVQQLLARAADEEGQPLHELVGEDVDVENDSLETIVDSLDPELLEFLEELYLEDCPAFPDKYDIHEYRIMERFIGDETEGEICDQLYRAIQGRGAFRRFRNELERFGLVQRWYDYRDQEYIRIAREWAENNHIQVIG